MPIAFTDSMGLGREPIGGANPDSLSPAGILRQGCGGFEEFSICLAVSGPSSWDGFTVGCISNEVQVGGPHRGGACSEFPLLQRFCRSRELFSFSFRGEDL